MTQSRREFITGMTAAGAVALAGLGLKPADAEPPPETTTLRLGGEGQGAAICFAPQYVAEELLRAEGFTDVEYVKDVGVTALASGELDLNMANAGPLVIRVDAGKPIVALAGVHVGCYELFGSDRIRSLRDLKGKTVAATDLGTGRHTFLASMAAHVGLDPRTDIHWAKEPAPEAMRLFAEGKVDAFMAFPPEPQELRARKVGRVVVNTTTDRPWSQYYCCLVAGHREFVRRHPVATKRAVRAILKASQVCALEPDRAARRLVDKGYTTHYDYALQAMKEILYGQWREYNPEDTVRFYALRLHEAGLIKSNPRRILAQGTDWRFLNELKKELKG